MRQKQNGLNDSDKIFVTIALWIACISIFATAIALPMLPEEVTIFYKPIEIESIIDPLKPSEEAKPEKADDASLESEPELYSKYNNLFILFASAIPLVVLLVSASLKKRGHLARNFPSIMIFCIMLSVCFSGVNIYGIMQQMTSSIPVRSADIHSISALLICAALSFVFALAPTLTHTPNFAARATRRSLKATYLFGAVERYWFVGAYGFLVSGIAAAFIPFGYGYIPLAVMAVLVAVFYIVAAYLTVKHRLETVVYDSIDQ